METLDYQMMDSILVATLFIIFLVSLFGVYGLFKKTRDQERRIAYLETTLAELSDTVNNIALFPGVHSKIVTLRQDQTLQ